MTNATTYKTLAGLALALVAALATLVWFAGAAQAAGTGTLTVLPNPSSSLVPGNSIQVVIQQNATVNTTGAQTNLSFDKTKLQITDVTLGPAWTSAVFLIGVAPQTKAQAIAQANSYGTLMNVAGFYAPGSFVVPPGAETFAIVTMQVIAGGSPSSLNLSGMLMNDANGDSIPATGNSGTVSFAPPQVGGIVETVTGSTTGGGFPLLAALAVAIAGAVALGGLGVQFGYRTRKG